MFRLSFDRRETNLRGGVVVAKDAREAIVLEHDQYEALDLRRVLGGRGGRAEHRQHGRRQNQEPREEHLRLPAATDWTLWSGLH